MEEIQPQESFPALPPAPELESMFGPSFGVSSSGIGAGAVNNQGIFPSARYAKVVVGPTPGAGIDTTSIQEGIDKASALGGGVVLVKTGTYQPRASIEAKDNVLVIGEDLQGVIIDFSLATSSLGSSGLGYSMGGFRFDGISKTSAGTIAVTNLSPTVNGTFTLFNKALPGDKILLDGVIYTIKSITNDTLLTLTLDYQGYTQTGAGCQIIDPVVNAGISTLTILNGRNIGLSFMRSENCSARGVLVSGASGADGFGCYAETNVGLSIQNFTVFNTQSSSSGEGNGSGIRLMASDSCFLENILSYSNKGEGIIMSASDRTVVTNSLCVHNKQGLVIDDSSECRILAVKAVSNSSDGFYLEGNSDAVIASGPKWNSLIGCLAKNNGGDGFRIHDESNGGGAFGQGGDVITANTISACHSRNNLGWGIRLSLGAGATSVGLTNTILTANDVRTGNSSGRISDSGTGTIKTPFYLSGATTSIANTTVETDLVAFTIPAGTLGLSGAIKLHTMFEFFNNTGANTTLTIRVYWGGTLISGSVVVYNAATNGAGQNVIETIIQGANSAIAQYQKTKINASHPGGLPNGFVEGHYGYTAWHALGDIAKDSNVAQILKVTVQFGTASPFINTGGGAASVANF